ncbi:hypothetical protein ABPG77_005867 [Micractinium sp. CCAP 211/92]
MNAQVQGGIYIQESEPRGRGPNRHVASAPAAGWQSAGQVSIIMGQVSEENTDGKGERGGRCRRPSGRRRRWRRRGRQAASCTLLQAADGFWDGVAGSFVGDQAARAWIDPQ